VSRWRERFIKDPSDLHSLMELMKDNYVLLRDLFMLTAASNPKTFPFVSLRGLQQMC
jgi:hypothetical protein